VAQEAEEIKQVVRSLYAGAALTVLNKGNPAACCGQGSTCCAGAADIDLTGGSYSAEELQHLPKEARLASLGCGNPTALAALSEGEVVLDLGSGGGIDVLLSARWVGPRGKVYGLDMTDEMLELARQNQAKSGLTNVEFLKGDIEQIPLPDNHVDVIISNCVINLAVDKDRALGEAYRVLKPGGRLAVSDIVFQGDKNAIPASVLRRAEQWAGCLAGALTDEEYRAKLARAHFTDIAVEVTQVYTGQVLRQWLGDINWPEDRVRVISAFVRARKP
jgi:arsenite methyltransferase